MVDGGSRDYLGSYVRLPLSVLCAGLPPTENGFDNINRCAPEPLKSPTFLSILFLPL